MVRFFTILAITAISACATEPVRTGQTISVGTSDRGYLRDAAALSNRGEGYVRLRTGEGTRYGTSTLIGAIERAAREVARAFPGGYPLRVGDLSSPRGGAHSRHRSHRAGRDADLLFYARDAGGISTRAAGWLKFDRFGLAMHVERVYRFDEARNWHLVRTLVMDDDARVKWLFCSNELKARLLRFAARHERSSRAVVRATWILHQPSRGDTHDDHFHLRVGCSAAEKGLGCRDEAPHWPWSSDTARKDAARAGVAANDGRLVRWLLAEEHLDQRRHVARLRLSTATQPSIVATLR
jgi:penicillin-insensitive murein endopeptidase